MKRLEKEVKELIFRGRYQDILANCDYKDEAYKVMADNIFKSGVEEKRGFV